MSELLRNSKIDVNKDMQVDLRELQQALDEWFFDKLQPHEKSKLIIDLQQIDSLLEESFCRSLTEAYLDANNRIGTRGSILVAISPKDQAIIDLYHTLSGNSTWKHWMYQKVEDEKRQQKDYRERREGTPYSPQRLKGKQREFMSHNVFKNWTHDQKGILLQSEVNKIQSLQDATPEQKSEWIKLLTEALLFTANGKPSIFALKDRVLGQRSKNAELIKTFQNQIEKDRESLKKLLESIGESTAFLDYGDPKIFLMKKQLHFAQLAQKYFDKMIALPDNEWGGSFASWWKMLYWEEFVPFVSELNGRYTSTMARKLGARKEGGDSINDEEIAKYEELYGEVAVAWQEMFLQSYQGLQALERFDYGAWHNIWKAVGTTLPYMGEMFYLGPIFRGIGFATNTISSAKKTQKVLMKTSNTLVRGKATAAVNVPRSSNMTAERMSEFYSTEFDDQGNISFRKVGVSEKFLEAFAKSFGSLWVEMVVEHGMRDVIKAAKLAGYAGAEKLIGKEVPPDIVAEWLVSRWLKRFASEFPKAKTAQDIWKSLIEKRGKEWVKNALQRDGIFTEYIEEEVAGRLTNVVTGDRGDRNPFYLSTKREVFETFMTTLIVWGWMKAIQVGAQETVWRKERAEQNLIDAQHIEEVSSTQESSTTSEWKATNDYLEGKTSRFWFTEQEVHENNSLRERPNGQELVRQKIIELAKEKWLDDNLQLTSAQVERIFEAHLMPWELGKISLTELLAKVRILEETFSWHPRVAELMRLVLEGGFCGLANRTVKPLMQLYHTLWTKWPKGFQTRWRNRKDRLSPMSAVVSLCIFILANSLDKAERKVLHKMVDLGQKMSDSLAEQAERIEDMWSDFEAEMNLTKDQYDAIVANYIEFLELAKEYSNTWLWKWLNWLSDNKIEDVISAAESWQMTLLDAQEMANQMNTFLQDLQIRTDASLQVAKLFEKWMEKSHTYLDMFFDITQWIAAVALAASIFRARWVYLNKSTVEQKKMMKYTLVAAIGSITAVAVHFGKIDPMIQAWAADIVTKIQEVIDSLDAIGNK